ncbi:MAG: 50S ribosomal protein L10 [Chloroflexi bacterium]|nr:50S ribosomal protein L10 [Chloroflexota bacterium]MDA1270423.1 50S ribosomal protein L10 [Chloroflexota bacterium]PKB58931.1 MAG: 50S ribosomal protein L10 [SAR202 cluster bacterium Casp-Chloro-G2]
MPTQQKIDRVQELKDRLERSAITMTTSYAGISVNQMTELRRAMRNGGVEFNIVKNTLFSLAADAAQRPQLKEIINGPTAVAIGFDDPAVAAKVLADFIRTGGTPLAIQGAVMGDGAVMNAAQVTSLALLPPKDQLIAMLLGTMQAPIAQLLRVMNGPLQAFGNVLQARVRQLEEEGPAPVAEPEPAPEPEPAAEAPEASAASEPEAAAAEDAPADEQPAADENETKPEPAPEAESDGETESE